MIDPFSFAGEGWPAVLTAAPFFGIALLTLAWLRGPGSRPHDPPVARHRVRLFAGLAALFGASWLVRAVAGMGGSTVMFAAMMLVTLAVLARERARRS